MRAKQPSFDRRYGLSDACEACKFYYDCAIDRDNALRLMPTLRPV
jgi:hypothetical protein